MIYLIIYFVWKNKRLKIRIHIESLAMMNVFASWSAARTKLLDDWRPHVKKRHADGPMGMNTNVKIFILYINAHHKAFKGKVLKINHLCTMTQPGSIIG